MVCDGAVRSQDEVSKKKLIVFLMLVTSLGHFGADEVFLCASVDGLGVPKTSPGASGDSKSLDR